MRDLFGVLKYIKGYWRYAIGNIIANLFSVIFSIFSLTMVIPFLELLFNSSDENIRKLYGAGKPAFEPSIKFFLDYLNYFFSDLIVENGKTQALIVICISIVCVFFVKNLFRYLALYFMAPVRNGIVKDMRNNIYKKVLALPLSFYSEERKGDIMSRITSDVQEIEWSILTGLEMIFRDPLNIILSLIMLIGISPKLTIFVFIMLPLSAGLISIIGKSLKRSSHRAKEKLGTLFSIMEETLSGLRIIKAFNAEHHQQEKFFQTNQEFTREMVKTYRKVDLTSPMSEFLGSIIMMVVLYFGGILVLSPEQTLKPSEFIAYLLVFSQIIPPAKAITQAYSNVQRGMASVDRINNIINALITITDSSDAKTISSFEKSIEYKNVSFSYKKGDNGWVLKDVNLSIPKGKTIALVGQSGSGKTTLADMLPRFYDTDLGEITIDGTPLKNIKIKDLRSLMGVVSQEPILFNDSVFNNIVFGAKNISEEQVVEAAKVANAHDFIMQTADKYQTIIGDRGSKLSGGQRQRLSIARAVLKNPPILILDEATSALDTESERLVQDALNNLMRNRTSIVIAHRLSTIQHADEIVVLQKGEIVERGKHQQLIDLNGIYTKLYNLQLFK